MPLKKKKGKKRGTVKPLILLAAIGVFPLRKKRTERIKQEKNLSTASLWYQLAQLDCRATFWFQTTISYLLTVRMCVWYFSYAFGSVSIQCFKPR